ncbi:hypothetical protein BH09ACT6_BH09ACT6_15700 [soil metagenome]
MLRLGALNEGLIKGTWEAHLANRRLPPAGNPTEVGSTNCFANRFSGTEGSFKERSAGVFAVSTHNDRVGGNGIEGLGPRA